MPPSYAEYFRPSRFTSFISGAASIYVDRFLGFCTCRRHHHGKGKSILKVHELGFNVHSPDIKRLYLVLTITTSMYLRRGSQLAVSGLIVTNGEQYACSNGPGFSARYWQDNLLTGGDREVIAKFIRELMADA